jgi:hypothetical protein
MKKLLLILILSSSLQSSTAADDISDFEIEGISVGESALEYFSVKEIKSAHKNEYKDDAFYDIEIYNHKLLENYKNLQLSFKKNDKNYIIYSIVGFNFYKKNIQECLNKVDEVSKEISNIIKNTRKISNYKSHAADPSGKSKNKQIIFIHETGSITLECYDWSDEITKKDGWVDNFGVSISLKEYDTWITYKAYK